MMTVAEWAAELLERAADLLEKNRWTRGQNRRVIYGHEAYCSVGAINEVVEDALTMEYREANEISSARYRAQHTLNQVVLERIQEKGWPLGVNPHLRMVSHISIEQWNDSVAKDKQEVLDVFREAAKRAGEE